ncbi:MAG: DUF3817 domain-containing protein [Bacteroidota bacterium]|nr:DUF3817 domain-containing protein [Bacteroidota bacterium]
MTNDRTLNLVLKIGFIEGISYLILLFIAMPLKYFANMPLAVKYVGMIHGVLFVAFCVVLLIATLEYKWSIKKAGLAFLLSLVPFGTFYLDKLLRK